jgi:hypothetical protein
MGGQHYAPEALSGQKGLIPLVRTGLRPDWMGPEITLSTGVRIPDQRACRKSQYGLRSPDRL